MYSLEVIAKSIAEMDDEQLIQRWKTGSFSDDAKSLAQAELLKRGFDPSNPIIQSDKPDIPLKPYKPRLIPALFASIAASSFGREIGAAIAGATGAGIFAAIAALIGFYLGAKIAKFAYKKHFLIKIIFLITALVAWAFLSTLGMFLARYI